MKKIFLINFMEYQPPLPPPFLNSSHVPVHPYRTVRAVPPSEVPGRYTANCVKRTQRTRTKLGKNPEDFSVVLAGNLNLIAVVFKKPYVFSYYIHCKTKTKQKIQRIYTKNLLSFKTSKIEILLGHIYENLIIFMYRGPGVTRGPTKKLGQIGSAVLTFIGYKQTNTQAKYLYRYWIMEI